MTKKLGKLIPLEPLDLQKVKEGETIQVEIKKPRNVGFHRKFFALINLAFQNQDVFENSEYFREEMLKASGYFEHYVNHKGIDCYKAKSISFGKMSQDEFETLYIQIFDTIVSLFKWEEVKEEFKKELDNFI
jgi:hypothetical protein